VPIDDESQIRHGQPILESGNEDIAALVEKGELKVRVLEGDDFVKLADTGRTEVVGNLLGPLAESDVSIIRCIGLNYKTHSRFDLACVL